jgi:hypothetical protein
MIGIGGNREAGLSAPLSSFSEPGGIEPEVH